MTKKLQESASKFVVAIAASTASRCCSTRGGRSRHRLCGKPKKPKPPKDDHADLLDGLKGLGLATVTAAQVAEAVKELYPRGIAGSSRWRGLAGRFPPPSPPEYER